MGCIVFKLVINKNNPKTVPATIRHTTAIQQESEGSKAVRTRFEDDPKFFFCVPCGDKEQREQIEAIFHHAPFLRSFVVGSYRCQCAVIWVSFVYPSWHQQLRTRAKQY
jgi:hypothetical protein